MNPVGRIAFKVELVGQAVAAFSVDAAEYAVWRRNAVPSQAGSHHAARGRGAHNARRAAHRRADFGADLRVEDALRAVLSRRACRKRLVEPRQHRGIQEGRYHVVEPEHIRIGKQRLCERSSALDVAHLRERRLTDGVLDDQPRRKFARDFGQHPAIVNFAASHAPVDFPIADSRFVAPARPFRPVFARFVQRRRRVRILKAHLRRDPKPQPRVAERLRLFTERFQPFGRRAAVMGEFFGIGVAPAEEVGRAGEVGCAHRHVPAVVDHQIERGTVGPVERVIVVPLAEQRLVGQRIAQLRCAFAGDAQLLRGQALIGECTHIVIAGARGFGNQIHVFTPPLSGYDSCGRAFERRGDHGVARLDSPAAREQIVRRNAVKRRELHDDSAFRP